MAIPEWQTLNVALSELCLNTTLRCGQSFRWRQQAETWCIALYGRILILKQDADNLYFRSVPPDPVHPYSTKDLIEHYFNLGPSLALLYKHWSSRDAHFADKAPYFSGVRILRQDPWEALIGFICSSNNNIARIGKMVSSLCFRYGEKVGEIHGEPFFDFPSPEALAKYDVEAQLRALGFGYRSKYVHATACAVVKNGGESWLRSLSNPMPATDLSNEDDWDPAGRIGYRDAHAALLKLSGVGPKVADCVCLMGLGWGEAVPVDTHVWQIAKRHYNFFPSAGRKETGNLNKALYDQVANGFRTLWGREAGWAHSVLFAADLKIFKDRGKPGSTEADIELEPTEEMGTTDATAKEMGIRGMEAPSKKRKVKPEVETDGAIKQVVTAEKRRKART
ncbi:DNA glycosylase [Piedraia hortae CBS 480.64]|uniref:DNA-(apurinic or apyrimidinic site) lyase n=1 Tax=Piedraia hortae CBS 480.64 TaxID=1314780 RepID=A0A6A7C9U4_9PEZI|nr:DNA glycosylase [Piedraia hortae CBS 480.64]